MSKDDLGDRMKRFENVSRNYLVSKIPVIIRVDGRHFHSLKLDKPYDFGFIECMVDSAHKVAKEIEGCKAAYIQSDEATFLLTDYENLNTQGWFGYNINKLVSITASLMSASLSRLLYPINVSFDARAFNVPKDDVVNCFLWRAKDWYRNSIQMLGQARFSHKELDKKSLSDIREMLHGFGINWDLADGRIKNGTFLIRDDKGFDTRSDIEPHYIEIAKVLNPFINISLDKVDGV